MFNQFDRSDKSGQSNLSALMNGPEFALFNREAHNSPAWPPPMHLDPWA